VSNPAGAVRGQGEGWHRVGPEHEEYVVTQYLMSVWYPAGATQPDPDELERITREVDAVHRGLEEQGAWVFGAGLHGPDTATVVQSKGGRPVTTDGPFVETKEVLGGFSVIQVADLDEALVWAERMSEATACPIEVRPLHGPSAG
jgi:hypothetical protein